MEIYILYLKICVDVIFLVALKFKASHSKIETFFSYYLIALVLGGSLSMHAMNTLPFLSYLTYFNFLSSLIILFILPLFYQTLKQGKQKFIAFLLAVLLFMLLLLLLIMFFTPSKEYYLTYQAVDDVKNTNILAILLGFLGLFLFTRLFKHKTVFSFFKEYQLKEWVSFVFIFFLLFISLIKPLMWMSFTPVFYFFSMFL